MALGKILAIDDERNIRHLIQSEFTLEGFEVKTASSGEEGLERFCQDKFDVVLLDLRLPKMDGIETLRKLKQKSSATEVIMITGHGEIGSAVESIKLGARDYVTKPFKLDELLTLAKQVIPRPPGLPGRPEGNSSRRMSRRRVSSAAPVRPWQRFIKPSIGSPPPIPLY